MNHYYSYNELVKLNNKNTVGSDMLENFKNEIGEKEIIKNNTGLDQSLYNFLNLDIHLNPCRLMWGLYKIKNRLSDEGFSKKLVVIPDETSVKKFVNYSDNLSHRMIKYLDNTYTTYSDKKNNSISIVNNVIKNISNKCTVDTLSNKSNKLANAIITQMVTVPSEGRADNLYGSIIDYSSSSYSIINSALRGISKSISSDTFNDTVNNIANIDLVFDKYSVSSVGNDKGIRLYRGMSEVYYTRNNVAMKTDMVKDLEKGDIINDMGYVSSSLDINTSLGDFFTGQDKTNIEKSCCCIFTFKYPPHMPFIPMADFNIDSIVKKNELLKKQTTFGFTETELLLPRNFSLRIVDKIQLDELLNMDSLPAKNYRSITIVVCEVVFDIDNDYLDKIKLVSNNINLSSLIYKNIITKRNKFLFKDNNVKKKYIDMYKRKVDKFKISKTWFNDAKDNKDTISFVYQELSGGDAYDKYQKYKSKYVNLKKKLYGGDNTDYIKKISFSLKSLINLFMSISVEQNCCLVDLEQIKKNNDFQHSFMKIIIKNFISFKENIDKILNFPSYFESVAKRIDTYNIENLFDLLENYVWPSSIIIMDKYSIFIKQSLSDLGSIPFYNINSVSRSNYYSQLSDNNKLKLNKCILCGKDKNTIKCSHVTTSNITGGSLFDRTDELMVSCSKNISKTDTIHDTYSVKDFQQIKKCCNLAFGPSSCVEQFSTNFIIPLYAFNKEIFEILEKNYNDQSNLELFEGEIFRKKYGMVGIQKNKLKKSFDSVVQLRALMDKHKEKINMEVDKSISKIYFGKEKRNKLIQEKINSKYGSLNI